MSLWDYKKKQEIEALDPSFAALIMAAAQKADTRNLWALTAPFPDLVQEAKDRYNAPGGMLEGD